MDVWTKTAARRGKESGTANDRERDVSNKPRCGVPHFCSQSVLKNNSSVPTWRDMIVTSPWM